MFCENGKGFTFQIGWTVRVRAPHRAGWKYDFIRMPICRSLQMYNLYGTDE
jgi:hypothetical protein